MSEPTNPWWRGDEGIGGIGFARFFAWAGLVIAVGALVFALVAPIAGNALRTVWITGFAAAGMWVAFLAMPRYRAEGVRRSPVVTAAMVVGGLTIAIMIYAFIVIVAASGGIDLPAPDYWTGEVDRSPAPDGVTT
ncbi:hypothetical protein [Agromyces sp. Marseille-P2726]|uniref:hypothetical protein n=1 Tax=Agromyces sp. Marseille-P2726 TaxID=2709132 RepID=UPI00157059F7|nr:hypothetical protein [Agromyces sp. Marseille-P2726]